MVTHVCGKGSHAFFARVYAMVVMVDDGDRAGHGDQHKRQLLYEGFGFAEHAVYLAQNAQRKTRERQQKDVAVWHPGRSRVECQ